MSQRKSDPPKDRQDDEGGGSVADPTPAAEAELSSTDRKKTDQKKTGRLMTFRAPEPSKRLIRALLPVNRWLNFGGIPGLRSLPGLRRVPGIRGLVNIPVIDFPKDNERRLAEAAAPPNACFITPNHPEFFTDWMLDKEVLGKVAPLAACWATHGVVNGMGGLAQKFWLKNNLIAQIPGAGGADGKAHSVQCALDGHGVLLHPEGQVGWHGDFIAPLFSGAVDMALEALRSGDCKGSVFVAPVVWKLSFNEDVSAALHRELDYVVDALGLPDGKMAGGARQDDLAKRLGAAYNSLLARDEETYGIHPDGLCYFDRQERLATRLNEILIERLEQLGAEATKDSDDAMRRARRWLRTADRKSDDARALRKLTGDIDRVKRLRREIYPGAQLTQEHIAESIKRLRNDYCRGTTRDAVNQFLPQPTGPRTAHIRVPEPLDISVLGETTAVDVLVDDLRRRMQMSLDAINQDLAARGTLITYANPFLN